MQTSPEWKILSEIEAEMDFEYEGDSLTPGGHNSGAGSFPVIGNVYGVGGSESV